jgi:predicted DCC family thiol-disulfide oxidoreductase YuxK
MAATAQPAVRPVFERLVFFDGVCNFCDGAVRWLVEHDPDSRLCFAALQGETAETLRRRHPQIPRDIDTMVYVDASEGVEKVYLRSQAVLRVWIEIAPERALPRWLLRLPLPVADLLYWLFASLRYRLFGKLAECRVPTPEERARFLP